MLRIPARYSGYSSLEPSSALPAGLGSVKRSLKTGECLMSVERNTL